MTNEQIIKAGKAKLVAAGKIGADEEIHTYKHWKKLGYQVFRGEKAVASMDIWNYFQKKSDGDDEEDQKEPQKGRMTLKKAYFFSTKQVFALE